MVGTMLLCAYAEKNLATVISRYTYINRTKKSKLMRKLMEFE